MTLGKERIVGHDIITFSGGHEQFHDLDLWALRHFFVTEAKAVAAEEKTDDAVSAAQFFESWVWHCPGVYLGIDFDSFLSASAGRISLLLRILLSARRKISDFGSVIPLTYLQTHVNSPTAYFTAPQPVDRFCSDIDRLVMLLKKENSFRSEVQRDGSEHRKGDIP